MKYLTRLNNSYYLQLDVPVYDELGRKIGTAKVSGDTAEVTITQNFELIERLIEERLLRTKSISCSVIKL